MNTRSQNSERNLQRASQGMTLVEVLVAFLVSGFAIAGIVGGYIVANTSVEKFGLSVAANSQASQMMEQMRSAKWDVSSFPPIDQLVASNFPTTVVTLQTNTGAGMVIYATNVATISTVSTNPPLRRIRVDTIWNFRGFQLLTNSIETIRAPDQ